MKGGGNEQNNSYSNNGGMHVGKLSAGILNMKIDTFDSRTTPSEGTIPGLAVGAGNPLGLPSGGKSKNSKKKVHLSFICFATLGTYLSSHQFSILFITKCTNTNFHNTRI